MPNSFTRGLIGGGLFCSILTLTTAAQAQGSLPLSEEAYWGDVPVVMSATRMAQPVTDAPVAVTVIDRRMIEASGAREIPELFRLVPGFIVGYHDGHTPSVSYHMSDERYSRRMQVLLDGRSIYTTAIGAVPWATLQISMDDIERIEVVRGPNSASYGANSFLGVINIITREAILEKGTSIKINLGDDGVRELFLRHGGGADKLDYRVSVGVTEDDGFGDRLDYKRTQQASLRADYQINSSDVLSFQGGLATGPRGVENRHIPKLSVDREKTVLNHHQHIKWERQLGLDESLSVQFYHIFQRNFETFYTSDFELSSTWRLDPNLNYLDFSRRTDRYDLELQHNVILTEGLRVAWGGGLRDDQVWGAENLMGDVEIHNHLKHGFMNMEWNPEGAWLFNAGAMVEDYSITGTAVSPRAGVNYHFSPAHAMRLTTSKAIRSPSMFEYATDYAAYGAKTNIYSGGTLVGPGPDLDITSWGGARQTKIERVTSFELGYHFSSLQRGLDLDFKLYRDDMKDLVLKVENPGGFGLPHSTLFLNDSDFVVEGAELEAKFTFVDSSSLYIGYAFTDFDYVASKYSTEDLGSIKMAPEHSLSLLYMLEFEKGISAGVGYYYLDEIQGWESSSLETIRKPVKRLDMKVARELSVFGMQTELALAARNVLGRYEEMEVLSYNPVKYPELNEVDSSAYVTVKIQLD